MTAASTADALRLRTILCLAGLLVAQRFTLPPMSAAACLIPLLLLAVPAIRVRHGFTLALIALLASVDLGGEAYAETPGVLRYLLYAALAAATLMGKWRFGRRGDVAVLAYLTLLVLNTIFHPHAWNAHSFSRDLIAVCLGCAVYFHAKPAHVEPLDNGLLGWFCAGVLASELLNILFFYQLSSGDYLNYSSFKFLVVMPCLYMLLNRKYAPAVAVGALTLVVLGAYASRMLMLTFLVTVLFILLRDVILHFRTSTAVFAGVLVALVFVAVEFSGSELDAFRVFAFLRAFNEMSDVEGLQLLDPIRFTENSIFFGQDIYHLLFGNGLGSGIFDTRGDFAFVPDDGAAFSSREISDSHFFRLHDSWTWFGYRLGLLPYLLFVAWALKGLLSRQPRTALAAVMMLMTLLNATFSIGGLFVCGAFALQYRRELAAERTSARQMEWQPARTQGSTGLQPTQTG